MREYRDRVLSLMWSSPSYMKKTPPRRGQLFPTLLFRVWIEALDLRHHFGDEVVLLPFYTGSHFKARKALDRRPSALQELLDGLVRILHEGLSAQRDLTERFAQTPFDHLGNDFRWLALSLGLVRQERPLLRHDIRRHIS